MNIVYVARKVLVSLRERMTASKRIESTVSFMMQVDPTEQCSLAKSRDGTRTSVQELMLVQRNISKHVIEQNRSVAV